MAGTTAIKRASLDDAWDKSLALKKTLRDVLREYESAARLVIAGGSLSSVSANGRSSQFSDKGTSPDDWVSIWRELIDLHDEIKAALTEASVAFTDERIKDEMMASAALQECNVAYPDYSEVRY